MRIIKNSQIVKFKNKSKIQLHEDPMRLLVTKFQFNKDL